MSFAQAEEIYSLIKLFPVKIEYFDNVNSFLDLHTTAHKYNLTAYDASYLQLAIAKNLPLVTLDQHLKRMAKKAGVQIWSQSKN